MSNTVYAKCKKCGFRMTPRLPGNRNLKVAETGTAYCFVCCGHRWWESTLNEPPICTGTMDLTGGIYHDGSTCPTHEEAEWEPFMAPDEPILLPIDDVFDPVLEALLDEEAGITTPPKVVTSEIHIVAKANEFLSTPSKVDNLVTKLTKIADAYYALAIAMDGYDDVEEESYYGKAQGLRLAAKYVEKEFK